MSAISIVIADDHLVVRKGLEAMFNRSPLIRVAATAGNGNEAMEMVDQFRPNVLVADLSMPGMAGTELVNTVVKKHPGLGVVVFSFHSNQEFVVGALASGARGYVPKDASTDELVEAVKTVAGGGRYLAAEYADHEVDIFERARSRDIKDPVSTLSRREREILPFLCSGMHYAAIAAQFGLSERTVECHRTNIISKLDLNNRSDLVLYALRRGLIPIN